MQFRSRLVEFWVMLYEMLTGNVRTLFTSLGNTI